MNRFVLLTALVACPPAVAGLHMPGEKGFPATPDSPLSFQRLIGELDRPRKYALDVPGDTTRADGLKEAAALRAKGTALTPDERLRLTALSLRLRDFAGAQAAFRQGSPDEQADWRMLANRALATFGEGDTIGALRDQSAVLDAMRGATPWQVKIEETQKDLFRKRAREERSGTKAEQPDDLFEWKFVGPSGEFEVGTIADVDSAKLAEATALTQHLLFATPEDARLWWLLAELYNARGDVDAASAIYDECVDGRRVGWPELFAHRRLVKAEVARRAYVPPPPPILPQGPRLWAAIAAVAVPLALLGGWQLWLLRRRTARRG